MKLFIILFTIIIFIIIYYSLTYNKICSNYMYANDSLWEKKKNITYNNCYAYAFQDLSDNRIEKPQPGYKVNLPPLTRAEYTPKNFISRILLDYPNAEYLGNDHEIGYRNCKCVNNQNRHMVFLALDNTGPDIDYHFYRKNHNGYWTHKPGSSEVLHVDADNEYILNPYFINRKYKTYDYNISCGFFCTNTLKF